MPTGSLITEELSRYLHEEGHPVSKWEAVEAREAVLAHRRSSPGSGWEAHNVALSWVQVGSSASIQHGHHRIWTHECRRQRQTVAEATAW